jgi:GNAT superfamily N-acetyltransferase
MDMDQIADKLRIRLAGRDDIPTLQGLISQSYRTLGAGHYSPRQIESALVYLVGSDAQMIDDRTYYVAEVDGQIAGGGGWCKRRKLMGGDEIRDAGNDELLDPTRDPAGIRGFFVHPSLARCGIGRRLLETCEKAAQQANFTMLELIATKMGEPLYASFGFSATERVERLLPDGVVAPATRMLKTLDCMDYRSLLHGVAKQRNGQHLTLRSIMLSPNKSIQRGVGR